LLNAKPAADCPLPFGEFGLPRSSNHHPEFSSYSFSDSDSDSDSTAAMHFTIAAVLCTLSLLLSTAAAAGPLPPLPIFNPNAAVLDTAPDYAATGRPPSFKPPVSTKVTGMHFLMQHKNYAVSNLGR
ncbi:MAG: hypothetical protein LQ341_007337, partial [Variospora aurantia]